MSISRILGSVSPRRTTHCIMNNEVITSWVYNVIGLWYHMGYLFRNGFVCIVRRCKLLNPENISGYHQINKIGEFLQFSSKRKGIMAWNFRMMIRKIWRFLWYQNRNNFEKNEKRKDQAPLSKWKDKTLEARQNTGSSFTLGLVIFWWPPFIFECACKVSKCVFRLSLTLRVSYTWE